VIESLYSGRLEEQTGNGICPEKCQTSVWKGCCCLSRWQLFFVCLFYTETDVLRCNCFFVCVFV